MYFGSVFRKQVFQFVIVGFTAVLIIQLFRMQIVEQKSYSKKADQNSIKQITKSAPRGIFYDRNFNVLISNRLAFTLKITPDKFETKNEKIIHSLLALAFFSLLSLNTVAGQWVFQEDKGKGCMIKMDVNDKDPGELLAMFVMFKTSESEMKRYSDFKRNILLRETSFLVETTNNAKGEKGVDIKISSASISDYMSYMVDPQKSDFYIYASSSLVGQKLIDALQNNEEITIEFNMASYEVKYGIVSAEGFKKAYKQYKQCIQPFSGI